MHLKIAELLVAALFEMAVAAADDDEFGIWPPEIKFWPFKKKKITKI